MRLFAPFFLAMAMALSYCQTKSTENEQVTVDYDFQKVFYPDSGGVTGADGIFSVSLPGGSSAFLNGDCFLGYVRNGSRDLSTKMLNNSIVIVNAEGTSARSVYRGTYDDPETLFVPEQTGETKEWYWPGHGFAEDTVLYMFALHMYNNPKLAVKSEKPDEEQDKADKMEETMWSFAVAGVDLLRFSLPDFRLLGVDSVKYTYEIDFHLGNCVYTEGNTIYICGTRNESDGSHIYFARTYRGNYPYHENWDFFDGTEWVADHHKAAPMKMDISVSEQFSIFKIKDKYVLLSMAKSTQDIYTYTSDFPYKGFENKTLIYHTTEHEKDTTKQLFTYNALAHPQYMDGDRLLVSYCINSMTVRDVFTNVDNYRARFIRVPLGMIDPSFKGYKPDFMLALAQMKVDGGNRQANLDKARAMIAEAAENGANIVLLPELMDLGWAHPSVLTQATEIPGGESCRVLTEAARENHVYVCSGLAEKDGGEIFNSALFIDPSGKILLHHRKINILDIAQPFYGQGRSLNVAETRFGSIGLMICADAFADQRVISQTLCYMGADIILSPTSWALPADLKQDKKLATDIWYNHYSPVAKKYSVYIAGCSNVGVLTDGPWKGFSAIGNSMVIGPGGNIVAGGQFGEDAETIIYSRIKIHNRPVRGTDWMKLFEKRESIDAS